VLRDGLERDPLAPALWLELSGQLERSGEPEALSGVLFEEWLPTCAYATLRAPFMAERIAERFPAAIPADRVESVQACRVGIAERLSRIQARDVTTTPAPPR
jgi:hypothetical protein